MVPHATSPTCGKVGSSRSPPYGSAHLVELQHVAGDREGVLARVPVDDLEELGDTPGGEPGVAGAAVDREGLAAAGLRGDAKRG